MASSGTLRRVALGRTYVSQELIASFIRVTRICELGTTLAETNNRRYSSETSVITRATRRNIQEDAIHIVYVMFASVNFTSIGNGKLSFETSF
jgi:hypothetical protein